MKNHQFFTILINFDRHFYNFKGHMDHLKKWIWKLEHGEKLTEDELRVLCERVKSMLTQESDVHKVPSPVTICGIHNLMKLTEDSVRPDTNYIFMGDFIEHGYNLEVFTKLLLLKARYPEKIFLLRGNIERKQATQVEENDNTQKYCNDVIASFTPSPNIDGIVVCVGGCDVRRIDQMAILCPVQGTSIRDPPYVIDNCWQSRYKTEFKELEYIDEGSYGYVYKASNNLDGKEYAIKKIVLRDVLDDVDVDDIEPFEFVKREVIIMAMMNHPGIIRYYQAWIEPRFAIPEFTTEEKDVVAEMKADKTRLSPCLYMQLQHCSRTLKDFLVDPNSTETLRVRVWNQIIEGLRYIHSRNVVHLDLHRGNIFMDSEDNAVIADFGLARRLNVDRHIRLKPGRSEQGYWMSPEVKEGRENISTAADVFSLGFICYELFRFQAVMHQQFSEDVAKLKSGYILEDWGTDFTSNFLTSMVSSDPLDRPSLQETFEMFADLLEPELPM